MTSWREVYPYAAIHAQAGRTLLYFPKLNDITDNVVASIMLQQILYWAERNNEDDPGQPFYKFFSPCNHELYRKGDSWQEELNVTQGVIQRALSKIATKIVSGVKKFDVLEKVEYTSMVIFWTDAQRVTWWQVNIPVVNLVLEHLAKGTLAKLPKKLAKRDFLGNSQNADYLESDKTRITYSSTKMINKDELHISDLTPPPAPQDEAPQAEKERSPKEDDHDRSQDFEQKKEAQSPETDLSLTTRNLGEQKIETASQDPETSIDASTVVTKETNILQFSAMEDQRKKAANPNGRVRSGHGLVRELIAGVTDRVDEFVEWRGARLKTTDAYRECSMSPAVVLNFYAKRLPKPWNSEQESAQIMADLKETIAAEVQQCPSLAKNELKDAKEEVLAQIAALYAQDPAKAFELGTKHRLWNEFKRRQQMGQA